MTLKLSRDPTKPGSFAANPQLWNDGSERFYSGQNEVDDVEFLNRMLDYRTLNATYLEQVRTAVQSGAYSPTGNALKALIAAHGREDQP